MPEVHVLYIAVDNDLLIDADPDGAVAGDKQQTWCTAQLCSADSDGSLAVRSEEPYGDTDGPIKHPVWSALCNAESPDGRYYDEAGTDPWPRETINTAS